MSNMKQIWIAHDSSKWWILVLKNASILPIWTTVTVSKFPFSAFFPQMRGRDVKLPYLVNHMCRFCDWSGNVGYTKNTYSWGLGSYDCRLECRICLVSENGCCTSKERKTVRKDIILVSCQSYRHAITFVSFASVIPLVEGTLLQDAVPLFGSVVSCDMSVKSIY